MPSIASRRNHGWAQGLSLAVVLAVGLASPVLGAESEADSISELRQKLDQSMKMIDALAARVRELEAKATDAALPAASAAAPEVVERIDAVENKVAQIETTNATRHGDESGVPLHGFADVGAGSRNPYDASLKGVFVGDLDFYLTPHLGDHTRALFELNFETGEDGTIGVDLERAQIGYQFGDHATVWLGRFHTPYGYINTAMHHGAWVSDALRRPKFVEFEDQGGNLPAHTVGAWLTGSDRVGGGKVLYDVYVGNGQEIIGGVVDMRNAGNTHGNLIVGGRLGYQIGSGAFEGLTIGVHALTSRIDDDQNPVDSTRVNMYGGYVVYDTDNWEHDAEFYRFSDEDLTTGTGRHRSSAGFVQLGYRAPWGVPYLRYERSVLQQTDQYFLQQSSGNSYYRTAVGMRFDLDIKSALKFELANTHDTDRLVDQYDEALVQYAIRF